MNKSYAKVKTFGKWITDTLEGNELGFGDLMYKQPEEDKKEKDMTTWQAISFALLFFVFAIVIMLLRHYGWA